MIKNILFIGLLICTVGAAQAQDRAGVVERMSGEAYRVADGAYAFLEQGAPVFVDDAIETAPYTRIRLRFDDGSTLTLGENAEIVIDSFIYSPSGGGNAQSLDIARGVFRFVTGAVAAADPSDFQFETPVAVIGVRGTDFVGGELFVGMPPGVPHYGFQVRDGAIEVNAPGGAAVLDAPGEGTFLPIGSVAAPTPVRQWTEAEAAEADAALAFP